MRWLCAALVAVPLAARADVSVGYGAPAAIALRPADGVIFTAGEARRMQLEWVFGERARYFTPTRAQVHRLEAVLPAHVAHLAVDDPIVRMVSAHLATDKRQYFGVERKGVRVIHVEGICALDAEEDDWRHVYVAVDDGGDCYWSIDYDVRTGTWGEMFVHPIA